MPPAPAVEGEGGRCARPNGSSRGPILSPGRTPDGGHFFQHSGVAGGAPRGGGASTRQTSSLEGCPAQEAPACASECVHVSVSVCARARGCSARQPAPDPELAAAPSRASPSHTRVPRACAAAEGTGCSREKPRSGPQSQGPGRAGLRTYPRLLGKPHSGPELLGAHRGLPLGGGFQARGTQASAIWDWASSVSPAPARLCPSPDPRSTWEGF